MRRLVAQDAHAPLRRAAFDLEHVGPLEALEPGMREVERDGHAGHAVGRKPLVRQPEMRLEIDEAAALQLLLYLPDAAGDRAILDGHPQLAHPAIEEPIVRAVLPPLWRQYC